MSFPIAIRAECKSPIEPATKLMRVHLAIFWTEIIPRLAHTPIDQPPSFGDLVDWLAGWVVHYETKNGILEFPTEYTQPIIKELLAKLGYDP